MLKKLLETLTVREADLSRVESMLNTLIRGITVSVIILIVITLWWLVSTGHMQPWMILGLVWLAVMFGLTRLYRRGHISATINLLLTTITVYATLADPLGFPMPGLNQAAYAMPIVIAALLLTPTAGLIWAAIVTLANLSRMAVVAAIAGEAVNFGTLFLDTAGLNIVTLLMWLFGQAFQQTRQALRRQIRQGQASIEIGHTVTSALDPSSIIQQTVQLIYDAFGYYQVGLFTLSPDGRVAVLAEAAGEAAANLKERDFHISLAGASAVATAINEKQRRRVVSWEESVDHRGRPVQFTYDRLPTRAELALPLVVRDQVLGAIDIHSTALYPFPEEDIHTLEGLIGNVANALDIARLLDDVQQRHQELASVYAQTERRSRYLETTAQLAQATSALLDPEALLHRAVDLVSQGLDLYHAGIFMIDETAEWAVLTAANSQGGQQMMARGHKLRVGEQGIVGWVTQNGQPRIALDVGEDAVYFDNPDLPDTRSEVALPLKVGNRVIGALDVQSVREAAFSKEDMTVLQILADQVAVAIENARLFQSTQGALEEVQALQRYYVAQEWEQLSRQRSDLNAEYRSLGVPSIETALTPEMEMVLTKEEPIILPDLGSAEMGGDGRGHPEESQGPLPARAAMAIPIKLRGETIGVLDLQETDETRDWTEEEVETATSVADQLALALENARLFEEARSRAQELEGINEVGRAITSVLDQEAVLRQVVDITKSRFGHYFVSIALMEGNLLILKNSSTIGDSSIRLEGDKIIIDPQTDASLAAEAARTGQPVLVNDVLSDPRYLAIPELEDTLSEIDVPMIVKGHVTGVLNVQSDQPHAFSQTDMNLLQSLANQAGVAIENASLFEETQRRMSEIRLLHDVGLAAASEARLEETLQSVVEILAAEFKNASVAFMQLDPETDSLYVRNAIGYAEKLIDIFRIPVGKGITGWVAQHREPLLIRDVRQDPRYFDASSDIRSELTVPVIVGQKVLGVINLESTQVDAFTEDHQRLLTTLAGNLAVLLERARLTEETGRRARQLAAINEVGRAMTAVLDPDQLMRQVVDGIKDRFGYYFVNVSMTDGDQVAIRQASTIGDSDVRPEPRSVSFDINGVGLNAEAARTGQPVLVNDVREDPRYAFVPELPETTAELCVPIKIRGRVIGVLDLESARVNDFDETDVALFQSLATQAGAALENARLFEETQTALGETEEQARRLALLNEMSEQLAQATGLDEFLDIAAGKTSQILEADRASVAMLTPEGEFDIYALQGVEGATPTGARISGEGRALGRAVQERRLIIVPDDRSPDMPEIRSSMVAPLIAGGRVLGTLNVASKRLDAYTQRDGNLLMQIGSLLSSAIENRRLFEEARIRAEELAALNELAQALTAQLNVDQVLEETHRGASRLVDITNFSIGLYDPEKDELIIKRQETESEVDRQITTIPVSGSISGYAIHNRQSVLIKENLPERMKELGVEMVGELALSWLGVPLIIGDRVLGILVIQSFTTPGAYDEHDKDLLTAIASQVAIALQNANLFQETRTRAEELAVLNELAQTLTAQLDVDQVLEAAYRGASRLLDTTSFFIGLYDEDRREIRFPLHVTDSEIDRQIVSVPVDQGFSGYIVRNRTSLLFTDNVMERAREMDIKVVGDTSALSWLGVPLFVGDRVLGVMAVESYSTPGLFSEHALELMTAIASEVSIALQNANLFEETHSRAEELTVLNELAQALSAQLDVNQVLEETYRGATRLLDTTNFYVALYNPDKDEITFAFDIQEGEKREGVQSRRAGHGLTEHIIRSRQPLLIRDNLEQRMEELEIEMIGQTALSWLGVPLIIGGQVLGVIAVQSYTTSRVYDERHRDLLIAIAGQTATALQNANLFKETRTRAEELAVLNELSQALTAQLNMDQVINEAYRGASRLLNVESFSLGLYDPEQDEIAFPMTSTESEVDRKITAFPASEGVSGYMVRNRTSVLFEDRVGEQQEELGIKLVGEVSKSWVGVPLIVGDRVLGVMNVQSFTTPRAYDEHDRDLLAAIGSQVAIALQNANLFEETEQRAAQLAASAEVARSATAILDVDLLLDEAVKLISEQFGFYHAGVFLVDDQNEYAILEAAASEGGKRMLERGHRLKVGKVGIVGYVAATGEPRIALDVGKDAIHFVNPDLPDTRSEMGLPLKARERVIGVLDVQSTKESAFSEEDVAVLQLLTDQLATAIANANLFQRVREDANRRALVNEVNQAAASSLNIAELLARSGEAISRQNEMPCIIFEWDTEEEMALIPITVHDPAGLNVTPAEPVPITAEMDPTMFQAVRTRQLQVLFDVSSHIQGAAAELAEQLDLLDAAYIPLLSRDRVLGLLALGRQRGHPALDEGELSFLEMVATNLGVALENARLFQDAVETAQRLAEVDRLKSQFLANMSHELRTPLNSIIGFSRVILKEIDGPLTDMQRTDLETIYKSGQHLLGLINDVLEVSKIAAGKMELAFEDVDLQEVIKGVMSTAIALVKDKPIELQQSIAPDLPVIRGDARRLRQVIINLVGNAAKFTEEGFVRVEADIAPTKDGGPPTDVVVAVIDSGIGIADEKLETIFEAFTQVDASTTRRAGGTGLGLSICQSYVELHGGRMWVESAIGEGSTFYISLPIEGPPQPEEESEEEGAEKKVEETTVPEKPTDKTSKLILCVEDDEGVITLFRRYLGKKGYQVVGLTDPTRVMEEAKRIKPHAITLDVMMPEKDGWEVIQDLKADAETQHIPVIMCTIVADKGRGISLGAADYLVKPIIEQDLLAALDHLDREAGRHLVLIVDDQEEHRELLRRMIESQDGYEVVEAGGGQEAITMLQQIQPQIIMLDLMMPEMDGFDVLESVKADERTRAIPIIIVTAKELTDEDRNRLNHNVEALVQKGVLEEEELLEDVATALKKLTRHLTPGEN